MPHLLGSWLLLAQADEVVSLAGKIGNLGATVLLAIAVIMLWVKCEKLLTENAKLRDDRIAEQAHLLRLATGQKEE